MLRADDSHSRFFFIASRSCRRLKRNAFVRLSSPTDPLNEIPTTCNSALSWAVSVDLSLTGTWGVLVARLPDPSLVFRRIYDYLTFMQFVVTLRISSGRCCGLCGFTRKRVIRSTWNLLELIVDTNFYHYQLAICSEHLSAIRYFTTSI